MTIKICLLQINIQAKQGRTNIAILDLKAYNFSQEESILLTEVLRSEMYKLSLFNIMNREDMKEIVGEQAFQNSGLCDDTGCIVEIGNLLGVDEIISIDSSICPLFSFF